MHDKETYFYTFLLLTWLVGGFSVSTSSEVRQSTGRHQLGLDQLQGRIILLLANCETSNTSYYLKKLIFWQFLNDLLIHQKYPPLRLKFRYNGRVTTKDFTFHIYVYVMIFLLKTGLCIKVIFMHNSCWFDYYDKCYVRWHICWSKNQTSFDFYE